MIHVNYTRTPKVGKNQGLSSIRIFERYVSEARALTLGFETPGATPEGA